MKSKSLPDERRESDTEYARRVQGEMLTHVIDLYHLAIVKRGKQRHRAIDNSLLAAKAAIFAAYCAVESEAGERKRKASAPFVPFPKWPRS